MKLGAATLRALGILGGIVSLISALCLVVMMGQFGGVPNASNVHNNKVYWQASEATIETLHHQYLACLCLTPLSAMLLVVALWAAKRR